MSTHSETSGVVIVNDAGSSSIPKNGLESIRTWFNLFTLAMVGITLVLIAMAFSADAGMRPTGFTVVAAIVLLGLCRVIAVFAAALQRIERKLHGLPPVG